MDVVYIVGSGDRNAELRHSLRSLANLAHDRVWIAGYQPNWVQGVGAIPVAQDGSRYQNGAANLRAACENPEISEEFIYFNDDFFVIAPVEQMPVYHRGPLADLLTKGRRGQLNYSGGRQDTAHLLRSLGYANALAYEPLHMPMVFRKAEMLRTLEIGSKVPALHYRTLYGNLNDVGGTRHVNAKISDLVTMPQPGWLFVSTNERAFDSGRVGAMLRGRFPDPGPYEEAA